MDWFISIDWFICCELEKGLSALLASSIAYLLAPYMNYSQEEIDNGFSRI